MIDENDIASIPSHLPAEHKFRRVEQMALNRLSQRGFNDEALFDDFDYMTSVQPAAEVFGINELSGWKLPSRSDDFWREECRNFRAEATRISQLIMYQEFHNGTKDRETVALNPATKDLLRFHIGQVRKIVDHEPIGTDKKDAIYRAISRLELEIDKSRTRMTVAIDLVAQACDGAEPILEKVQKLVAIIWGAKNSEDIQEGLPSPNKPKQIEGPKSERSQNFDKLIDEEIPF